MIAFGDVAQLGERLPCTQEVAGSTPVVSIHSEIATRGNTSDGGPDRVRGDIAPTRAGVVVPITGRASVPTDPGIVG